MNIELRVLYDLPLHRLNAHCPCGNKATCSMITDFVDGKTSTSYICDACAIAYADSMPEMRDRRTSQIDRGFILDIKSYARISKRLHDRRYESKNLDLWPEDLNVS